MGSLPYLLQPWRYDFEYARAWMRTDFPVFGLVAPSPDVRRMGSKGSTSWPKQLHNVIHLGVNAVADTWSVDIDSRKESLGPDASNVFAEHGCAGQAGYRLHDDGTFDCSPTRVEHTLLVNELSQKFVGFSIDAVWVGSAEIAGRTVMVTADGIDPERLQLAEITDVAPYLQGQRRYMRR